MAPARPYPHELPTNGPLLRTSLGQKPGSRRCSPTQTPVQLDQTDGNPERHVLAHAGSDEVPHGGVSLLPKSTRTNSRTHSAPASIATSRAVPTLCAPRARPREPASQGGGAAPGADCTGGRRDGLRHIPRRCWCCCTTPCP